MKRFRRMAASTSLTLILWMLAADFVHAANLDWINAAGGNAGGVANWNPAQVPTAIDWLFFNLNNTYTVTFGAAVPASTEIGVDDGNVTFRFPTAHTNSSVLFVGQAGGQADLTIASGSLTLARNLYIAQVAGDTGTVNITGPTTSVAATLSTGVTSIGQEGTGTLNILDGATLTVANSPEFGDRQVGMGVLVVAGVSTTSPFPRSRLIVNNSPTDPMELGSNGTGVAGVLLGAQMDIAGSLYLGKGSIGTGGGSLVVVGTGGSDSARVNIGGDLKISRNDNSGVQAVTGLVTVSGGGVVDVAGSTYTFDPDGSDGELEVRENSRFETGSLFVGDPPTELDFTGGRLQVRGGTLDLNGKALRLNSTTGTPTLELYDNAQAVIHSASAPALTVGDSAAGRLNVFNTADLIVHDFNAIIGNNAGSVGTLELNDPGSSLTVDQALLVGRAGTGTFNALSESQATLFSLGVATQPGSNGTVNISASGTDVVVTDLFELAGLSTGASGAPGVVNVSNDGVLWLNRPLISGDVWPTGTMNITSGGSLRLNGTLVNRGTLALNGGTTSGGVIQPIAGGTIAGTGNASSSIVALIDSSGSIIAGGALSLGSNSSPLGFQFLGTLNTNPYAVTLLDADSAVVGNVNLGGGTLNGPPGGIHLALDKRINGSGTITGPIRPEGRIIATNTNGLTFTGPLLGVGQGMNGTRFRFASGGSFIGYGRLEASIQVDSGATILPTSDITLGRAPLVSKVNIDGTLAVGPGVEVDLSGTDSTRVNGLVAMTGGYIQNLATSPLVIRPAGRITGSGTLMGTTVSGGTIDPALGVNDLRFETLFLLAGGKVSFDVADYTTHQLDTLVVTLGATLGGTLDIRTLPGFVPVAGDSFRVMSYATHAGTFANVTVNGGPSAGLVQMIYRSNGVWARILANSVDAPGSELASASREVRLSSLGSPARSMVFALELPQASTVTLELFDVSGRRVATLHDGELVAGRHRFDATRSAPATGGLCFARATVRSAQGAVVRTARAVRVP